MQGHSKILIPPSIPQGNTHHGSRSNPEFLGIKQKQAEGEFREKTHPAGSEVGNGIPGILGRGQENSLQPLQG